MEYNAEHVPLVGVPCVRKCGISFNFMLEPAKNRNAMSHVAGTVIICFIFLGKKGDRKVEYLTVCAMQLCILDSCIYLHKFYMKFGLILTFSSNG